MSTIKTGQTETIDGVEYVKVVRDITMDSHPVYTGEKRFRRHRRSSREVPKQVPSPQAVNKSEIR